MKAASVISQGQASTHIAYSSTFHHVTPSECEVKQTSQWHNFGTNSPYPFSLLFYKSETNPQLLFGPHHIHNTSSSGPEFGEEESCLMVDE